MVCGPSKENEKRATAYTLPTCLRSTDVHNTRIHKGPEVDSYLMAKSHRGYSWVGTLSLLFFLSSFFSLSPPFPPLYLSFPPSVFVSRGTCLHTCCFSLFPTSLQSTLKNLTTTRSVLDFHGEVHT